MRWDRSRLGRSFGVLVLGASVLARATGAWAANEYTRSTRRMRPTGRSPSTRVTAPSRTYLLTDQNPPVPTPIGRRVLRDYIPGVAEEMQKWPAFFRDIVMDVHLRSYYFNREIPLRPKPPIGPDTVHQEAWALGGWVGLQSGWLLDTFRAGAVGYTSQPAYAPADRDGTGLLAPGQGSIVVLGQVYGQLKYEDYAVLTGGRFLVNQGFVNPQDNRMIPNTFEGGTVTGAVGPVDYYAGYLTAMKQRNSDTFINMARAAGVTTGENRGMVLTTLNFDLARTECFGSAPGTPDLLRELLRARRLQHLLLQPGVSARPQRGLAHWIGVQYWDQRSVGSDLHGAFSTWQVGSRFQLGWRGFGFLAMMSATGGDSGVRSPYGGWQGYISLIETDFNLANEKAWETGVTYDWGGTTFERFKIPGLWTSLLYAEGFGIKAQAQDVPVGTRREIDLFTVYRPKRFPGFRFARSTPSTRSPWINCSDFRIIVDLEVPLL